MTIAVGVLTNSALIIGADSEEGTGYAGDFKHSRGKISGITTINFVKGVPTEARTIAVTGSGDSAYLRVLKRQVVDLFHERKYKSLDGFDAGLKSLVKTFFKEHVVPFSGFKSLADDLKVDLIVGIREKGEGRLWVTNLSTVYSVDVFEAATVGSGSSWARTILDNGFGVEDESVVSANIAHAIFIAKERAEGCGKETVICTLRANEYMLHANKKAVLELEDIFREYRGVDEAAAKYLAGWSPPDHGWTAYNSAKVTQLRKRIIKTCTKLYPDKDTLEWIRSRKLLPKPSDPQT
jgi:20S proteasome alpha/beta subunit